MAGNIDLNKASRWFAEFDSLCAKDGGKIWGVSFCGPILFVDPQSNQVAANRADAAHVLVPKAGVFVGRLPAGFSPANTAIEWQGTRWTMIMSWSLSERQRPRLRLMGHECFHRMQPQLKLESPGELCDHLDTADGRYWMQLEWNALQAALNAAPSARSAAVTDALWFRAARRARFPKAAEREDALEIHEGLAEYSGTRLVDYPDSNVVKIAVAQRQDDSGFVRSFAYVSGPLYGFLLDGASGDWRQHVTPKSDLGAMLATAMHLGPPAASQIQSASFAGDVEKRAAAYGGVALRAAEDARESQRRAQVTAWRAALVDGPVLIVDLTQVKSGSFDPGKVFPIAEKQVVYTTRELQADWGVLTIADGAILEDQNTNQGRVSLAGAAADYSTGKGWTLKLAPGWHVMAGARAGDFRVVKP